MKARPVLTAVSAARLLVVGLLRGYWPWIGFALVLLTLAGIIAAQSAAAVLAVIAGVSVGAFAVLGGAFYLSGASVVRHAHAYRRELPAVAVQIRAIEADHREDAHR